MINLNSSTISKMMQDIKKEIKSEGLILRRDFDAISIEELVSAIDKVNGSKIKLCSRIHRPLGSISDDLDRRLKNMNLPMFKRWYDRLGQHIEIVYDRRYDEDESITENRRSKKDCQIILSSSVSTETQSAYIHELAVAATGQNSSKASNYYEYQDAVPLFLTHLYHMTLDQTTLGRNEASKRAIAAAKQEGRDFLSDLERFERFPNVSDESKEEMLKQALETHLCYTSTDAFLQLKDRLETDADEVLSYVDRILTGRNTTIDMAEHFDIDTAGYKTMIKSAKDFANGGK